MSNLKVAVIMGGTSFERDFSLKSGKNVCRALEEAGHTVLPLDADSHLVDTLRSEMPDVAFVCVHGAGGEDGTIPALLEFLRIPYVGSTPAVCRASYNKPDVPFIMKRTFKSEDHHAIWPAEVALPSSAFRDLGAAGALDLIADRIEGGYPLAVKPARGGSAMGVSKVECQEELGSAIMGALAFDDTVLIQQWIEGVEISCTVYKGEDFIEVLPAVEIYKKDGLYDTEARLAPDKVERYCPVRSESLGHYEAVVEEIREIIDTCALEVFEAYGCRDLARVDLIWDGDNCYILDVKTFPGLSECSLAPLSAKSAGYSMSDICSHLVNMAYMRGC